jgi:hypothetical protein
MSVTLMAGLSFGTLLTMVLVPVVYAIIFKIESPANAMPSKPPPLGIETTV